MFWTAWPEAPFTRLSMAVTTTARPVRGSAYTPMSQKLEPRTFRTFGNCPRGGAPGRRAPFVKLSVQRMQASRVRLRLKPRVDRRQDAAVHGNQMGRERKGYLFSRQKGELLLDLGRMAVGADLVRHEPFVHFREMVRRRRAPTRARDARLGIDHDARKVDHLLLDKRRKSEDRARWIAPGICDKLRLLISSRCNSGRPYTAVFRRSGYWWQCSYHFS